MSESPVTERRPCQTPTLKFVNLGIQFSQLGCQRDNSVNRIFQHRHCSLENIKNQIGRFCDVAQQSVPHYL
jgi:hypothetical protein